MGWLSCWLAYAVVWTPGRAVPRTATLSLTLDDQPVEVAYPLGGDHHSLALEIIDQLGISSGLGCADRDCLVARLTDTLRSREPASLRDYLVQQGWTDDMVSTLHDVLNINFWHFAMLNDEDRNIKFDAAIRRAVERAGSGARVLDLGAGSGLLSMMAARAGAANVFAIERSALLSSVAPRILEKNGFVVNQTINWLSRDSTSVSMNDIGGQPCHILVSETLGVSVLDEAGLLYMSDLRDRLLAHSEPSRVSVIPARVVTYAAVVRSKALRELSWAEQAAGFEVSPLNGYREDKVRLRRMSKDWGFMLSESPPDIVAGPFQILTVDFRGDDPHAYDGGLNITQTMPVLSQGEVHAVITWFDAFLDDEPSSMMSTSPWARDNSFARQQHWGQLIELVPALTSASFQADSAGRCREGAVPPCLPYAEIGDAIQLSATIDSTGGVRCR